jgi:hypothetical protein
LRSDVISQHPTCLDPADRLHPINTASRGGNHELGACRPNGNGRDSTLRNLDNDDNTKCDGGFDRFGDSCSWILFRSPALLVWNEERTT